MRNKLSEDRRNGISGTCLPPENAKFEGHRWPVRECAARAVKTGGGRSHAPDLPEGSSVPLKFKGPRLATRKESSRTVIP